MADGNDNAAVGFRIVGVARELLVLNRLDLIIESVFVGFGVVFHLLLELRGVLPRA